MKSKLKKQQGPYTVNIKVRISPQQKAALEQTAVSYNVSVSSLIREMISPSEAPSSITECISRKLIKNEFLNRITALSLPNADKKKIIEELKDID